MLGINLIWENVKIKKIFIISEINNLHGLSVFNGKNLLFLDPQEIISILLAKNIYLKNIKISKIFPSKVILELTWRQPVARIATNQKPLFIDVEGFPALSNNDELINTLPQIYISRATFNSSTPDWRLIKAISLINELKKKELVLNHLTFNENNSEINALIDDSIEVLIPYNFDPLLLSPSLQTIISRFRIEGKFISKIDFRFEKPLVILKNE